MLIEIPDRDIWLSRARNALDAITNANIEIKEIYLATVAEVKSNNAALPWWKRIFASSKLPVYCKDVWDSDASRITQVINALRDSSTGNITITEQEFQDITYTGYLNNLQRFVYWPSW
jgi:hypothetical protein